MDYWSPAVRDLLGSVLQTSYSQALYGAANLVDIDSLKVIYLSLLPNASVKLIGKLGLCPHHSRHPSLPFYYPHHVAANGMQSHDPLDTVWIARAAMPPRYQSRPIANHSWVEVTHCSSGVIGRSHESLNATNTRAHGDPGIVLRRAIGPAWFYVAPGSGVSINVGRTVVLTMNAAKKLLNDIAKGDTHTRARGCRPPLQLAPSSSSNNSAGAKQHRTRQKVLLGVGAVQTRGGIEDAERVPDDDDGEKKREDVGFDSIQILEHKEFFSIEREQHSSHLCACTLSTETQ